MIRSHAIRLMLLALLPLSGLASPVSGQTTLEDELLQRGRQALAEGDTASAVTVFNEAVQAHPRSAPLHYERGRLYLQLADANPYDFDERLEARRSLEVALAVDPYNPAYVLELAKVLLMSGSRFDARRLFGRALDYAEDSDASPGDIAELHFQLGLFNEVRWRRLRDRHLLPTNWAGVPIEQGVSDPRAIWELFEQSFQPARQGEQEREDMLEHYRSALAADPAHTGAVRRMLAYLYDEGDVGEYMRVATRYTETRLDQPLGHLLVGLGHAVRTELEAADSAFTVGLSLMPEEDRREFVSIARILTARGAEAFEDLPADARDEYARRFWDISDPLFLTEENEYRVEFLARLVYVDLRYGVEEYRLRGWDTDRGIVHLRYGPPLRVANYPPATHRSQNQLATGVVFTVWSYGRNGPAFVFRENPGYRNAKFAGDFRSYTENVRSAQSATFDPSTLPHRLELPFQAARFRGSEPGEMDVEVHALVPLPELVAGSEEERGEVQVGLFFQDPDLALEVYRNVAHDTLAFGEAKERHVAWRITMPAEGSLLAAVEALEPSSRYSAAGRVTIPERKFPPGELSVSDLLLAEEIVALVEEPSERDQLRIRPKPGITYGPEEPIGVYLEIYELLPDAEELVNYELSVSVRVEEIHREGRVREVLGGLADRLGLTQEGREAAELNFERQARVHARDELPEYFTLTLPDAPPGRYSLTLTVRDLQSGAEASTVREFFVRR